MKRKTALTYAYEQKKILHGFSFVVGCDEVGRGCLAGPVVAGAVILDVRPAWPAGRFPISDLGNIQDSKLLSASQRDSSEKLIKQFSVAWGIGVVSEKVIDKINIHNASLLAMRKAVENVLRNLFVQAGRDMPPFLGEKNSVIAIDGKLNRCFDFAQDDGFKLSLVVDGKFVPYPAAGDKKALSRQFNMKQEAVVDGDATILSIAAASILAKVYRDKYMSKLHKKFPKYNFIQHKGYATAQHREVIKNFGLLSIHRRSFCKKYI